MLRQAAYRFGVSIHVLEEFDGKAVQQATLPIDRVDSLRLEAWGNPLKLIEVLEADACDPLVEISAGKNDSMAGSARLSMQASWRSEKSVASSTRLAAGTGLRSSPTR